MTPAFVQKLASGSTAAVSTGCVATAVADSGPGATIVGVYATNGTADVVNSVVDNSTQPGDVNTWQIKSVLSSNQGGQTTLHVFLCHLSRAIKTGDTITTALAVADSRHSLGFWEYSGFIQPIAKAFTNSTNKNFATNQGVSTSFTSGTLNNNQPALLLAAVSNNTGANAGQTMTGPTNSFNLRLGANNSGGGSVAKEATLFDRVITTPIGGSISTGATDAGTVGWVSWLFELTEGFGANDAQTRFSRGGSDT